VPIAMSHSVRVGIDRVDPWGVQTNVDDRLSPQAAKRLRLLGTLRGELNQIADAEVFRPSAERYLFALDPAHVDKR